MAQTSSFTIADGSGLEVLARLNEVIPALRTANSGSTGPSATAPGMLWLDTSMTPPQLKVRNAADDTWIVAHRESIPGYNFWGNPSASTGVPSVMTPEEARTALGFDQDTNWVQLPGGFILQWGTGVTNITGTLITFPTAFVNTPAVMMTSVANSTYVVRAMNRSNTGFWPRAETLAGAGADISFNYFAFGT